MKMRIIDLTQTLLPGIKTYKDSIPIIIHPINTIEEDGYYVNMLVLDEHAGTHVDAPRHFYKAGPDISDIPVSRLVGKAFVPHLFGSGEVSSHEIEESLSNHSHQVGEGWYILFNLKAGSRERYLGEDAAKYLNDLGIWGIGVNTSSPDKPPYPVHSILLKNNKIIIENLLIPRDLEGKTFTFIIAPLKIKGGSGSPARVIGLMDDE